MKTEIKTYGDILNKYGTYENYRKTPEGILASINACKSLIEEEQEKFIDVERLYEMGEPLEVVKAEKEKITKSLEFYQNKIKSLVIQLKNT